MSIVLSIFYEKENHRSKIYFKNIVEFQLLFKCLFPLLYNNNRDKEFNTIDNGFDLF